MGRLKTNVSLAQAQAEMTNIARQQARDYPDSNTGWSITVQPWQNTVVRNARLPLILLLGAVGFVLLIATANLANLCLARAATRQKEFAIRLALGAGRLRIARQFLMECLLLSVLGGAAGLLFARWTIGLLSGMIPATVPRADQIALDGRVLAFTLAVSIVVGLAFGLAPLLAFWRSDTNAPLNPAGRSATGTRDAHRLRAWLVTSQVALMIILLTGAGLLTRSFRRLNEIDLGFQPSHLVALDLTLGGPGYTNESRRIEYVQQLLNRLSGLSGVEDPAAVDGLPLDQGHADMEIALTSIDGNPPSTPGGKLNAVERLASAAYFQTMGLRLSRGRG